MKHVRLAQFEPHLFRQFCLKAAEPYFSTALGIGYDVTTRGYTERVSKAVFQAVTLRSAAMNAVIQYFESGGTREGLASGSLGPPTFIGLTAEQIAAGR